jgi:hypothetical protein
VTVTGQDDTLADGDIAYTIATAAATSTDPSYDNVDANDVSVTNLDDEVASFTIVEIGGNTQTTEDGVQQTFTVVLDVQPESDVVFQITDTDVDNSEFVLSTTTLTFTPLNWNTAQDVVLNPLLDGTPDGDQVITITVAVDNALSADPFDGLSGTVIATIFDIN